MSVSDGSGAWNLITFGDNVSNNTQPRLTKCEHTHHVHKYFENIDPVRNGKHHVKIKSNITRNVAIVGLYLFHFGLILHVFTWFRILKCWT